MTKGYGTLHTATDVELEKAIADIAANLEENSRIEASRPIWTQAILAIQNRRYLDQIEQRGARHEKLVIALAVAALLATFVQILVEICK